MKITVIPPHLVIVILFLTTPLSSMEQKQELLEEVYTCDPTRVRAIKATQLRKYPKEVFHAALTCPNTLEIIQEFDEALKNSTPWVEKFAHLVNETIRKDGGGSTGNPFFDSLIRKKIKTTP